MCLFCGHQPTRSSPSTLTLTNTNKYVQPGCNDYIDLMMASVIVPTILVAAKNWSTLAKEDLPTHMHTQTLCIQATPLVMFR